MSPDQKSIPTFRVTRGDPGQWNVTEEGVDKPLASFSSPTDARKYARELAKTRKGSTVQVLDQQNKQPSVWGSRKMPR
jgi:hypothetical protein